MVLGREATLLGTDNDVGYDPFMDRTNYLLKTARRCLRTGNIAVHSTIKKLACWVADILVGSDIKHNIEQYQIKVLGRDRK